MAVFAIVLIGVAAFVLKKEYASADTTNDAHKVYTTGDPTRGGLVWNKDHSSLVPEKTDDWFKRVSYQDRGFDTQQDSDQTLVLMKERSIDKLTPEQVTLLHKLIASKQQTPHEIGLSMLIRLQNHDDRVAFLPEIKALFIPGSGNVDFDRIMLAWYRFNDTKLAENLASKSNPDQAMAKEVQKVIDQFNYPGAKDVGGSG